MTRREALLLLARSAATYPLMRSGLFAQSQHGPPPPPPVAAPNPPLTDDEFVEEIVHRGFLYFWNEASPRTGLVRDRALASGEPDQRVTGSIAATGFGLAALSIGHARGYMPKHQIGARVVTTLNSLVNHAEQVNGFYYHFLDINTGKRVRLCEVSPIDTAILLCGMLTASAYFTSPEISRLAATIYRRVNWRWMMNGGTTFATGWTPEYKFIGARWDTYCELMMMYLLAMAAPLWNIPASSWDAFSRPTMQYAGYSWIGSTDPLFVHQFSHAWFDFRNQRDQYTDYFRNSAIATYTHKLFCQSLRWRWPDYTDNAWGITASDSRIGYQAWGGPPEIGLIDGTIVPCAAGGSVPFLPDETLACLKNLYTRHGAQAWKQYGFVDAFNPRTGWTDLDVIGIDQGITMMMVENQRSNFIWNNFMKNPQAKRAMEMAGFRPEAQAATAGK